jgi:hypothetical protein
MKWYGAKFYVWIIDQVFAEVIWLSPGKVFCASYHGYFISDHYIFPIISLHSLRVSIFHGHSATVCCLFSTLYRI